MFCSRSPASRSSVSSDDLTSPENKHKSPLSKLSVISRISMRKKKVCDNAIQLFNRQPNNVCLVKLSGERKNGEKGIY